MIGWVERAKIIFRSNGLDTGKFYYQTHLILQSADQIQPLEDKPAHPEQGNVPQDRDWKT